MRKHDRMRLPPDEQSSIEGMMSTRSADHRRAWPTQHAELARKEGWGLLLAGGDIRPHRGWIVKRFRVKKRDGRVRPRDIFETHDEARAFVEKQMEAGDTLATLAMTALARWQLT